MPLRLGLTLVLLIPALLLAQTLDQKIAAVLPKPEEERWLEIPWRLDLMAARREAEEQGKPLFLWIMNGHPLGCT